MKEVLIETIQTVDQLKELMYVFSAAFESEYSTPDEYLAEMLKNKSALSIGAFIDNKIIGGLIAFEMTPIHGTKELYIYDIAVHPEHQKQGIGKTLIEQLKIEAKERGVSAIFVEAESEDHEAVSFYRAIGGEEVAVNHFNFTLSA